MWVLKPFHSWIIILRKMDEGVLKHNFKGKIFLQSWLMESPYAIYGKADKTWKVFSTVYSICLQRFQAYMSAEGSEKVILIYMQLDVYYL